MNLKTKEVLYPKMETDKAVLVLKEKLKDNDFAKSLCEKWDFWIDRKTKELSPNQLFWIHKLVERQDGGYGHYNSIPQKEAKKLFSYFDNAKKRLKFPRMVFDGIKLTMAGDRSKYTGDIFIAGANGLYYGRISRKANFYKGRDCKPLMLNKIKRMLGDVDGEILTFGKELGYCCFCSKELENAKSRAVGYGKICADKWGLDWGNKIIEKENR